MNITRIYYNKETYNAIFMTQINNVASQNVSIDKDSLVRYNISENSVDFIDIETYKIVDAKSFSINKDTKKLDIVYYTTSEIDAIIDNVDAKQEINARLSDISTYLSSNNDSIATVEDLIIQNEINKIMNM